MCRRVCDGPQPLNSRQRQLFSFMTHLRAHGALDVGRSASSRSCVAAGRLARSTETGRDRDVFGPQDMCMYMSSHE